MRTLKILFAALFVATFAPTANSAEPSSPPKVGDKAPDFMLKTLDGKPITLANALKVGPVVVVVLRGYPGYQCPICSRQVASLIRSADQFDSKGAGVILIYPGPANQLQAKAREFLKGTKLPTNFTLLTDPGFAFTNAYRLRWNAPRETAYPSTFVINPDGTVGFALVSRKHGGRAETQDVIEALE